MQISLTPGENKTIDLLCANWSILIPIGTMLFLLCAFVVPRLVHQPTAELLHATINQLSERLPT